MVSAIACQLSSHHAEHQTALCRRIMIAFVLMTALVSGIFSLGIVVVVHVVEAHLVSDEMQRELNGVLHEDLWRRSSAPGYQTYFYAYLPEYAIPERFAALPEALPAKFAKATARSTSTFKKWMANVTCWYRSRINSKARERALFYIILAGFCHSSWSLAAGADHGRQGHGPLSRLAGQVRHCDQQAAAAPAL